MKTLYSLLVMAFCLACVNSSRGQMRQIYQDALDADNEVLELSFYSPSEGYVAFTKWIGYTADSGRTFTRKNITLGNVNYNGYPVNLTFGFGIKGVKAFSQDTIIVYGDYGFVPSILYSTDKGSTFLLVYHDRQDPFSFKTGITDMVFPQDHTTGYAVEADRILKTTNKGLSWSVVRVDMNRFYDHIESVDNNNLFAFSVQFASSKLFKTNNGGTSWTEVITPAGKINYTYFLTAAKGWLNIQNADQQGEIYYTSNGGTTWTRKNDPSVTPIYTSPMRFINDSTGYALGTAYTVLKTTDSGKVWQRLPRDNNFTHNTHFDLQVLNANQLWAGGGHGFIEISTNGGGTPFPRAYFKVDTNGVAATNTVNLRNFSKPNYQYKWFKNDTLISQAYHTSFTHSIYKFRDTIKLVVLNGSLTDTLVQYIDYPKVWITNFTPASQQQGGVVTITGFGFSTTSAVRFGGTHASTFTIISNTQINAVVGGGSSGNVEVYTSDGSAFRGGFIFLGPPVVDLPATISDSILCKSEPVTITIQNSEVGVVYHLIPWMGFDVVGGSVTGNGGTVSFTTTPISESNQYRIRATRVGSNGGSVFNNYFTIRVEKTRARFVTDQVNVTPGEPVSYIGQNGESKDFYWTLYQDASVATATGVKVSNVTYASSGQKTLRLIAVSENGCRDTIVSKSIFVYTAPAGDASCFINPMDSTGANGMVMGPVMKSHDDGIYAIGATNIGTKLRSMVGVAKEFAPGNHSTFAKYNSNGVLKWVHFFRPGAGAFTGGKVDAQGNIYLTGYSSSNQWLHFNYGDSMQFYASPVDTTYMGERSNGFVLKLDKDGKYIWHTILMDHITLWQGFAASATGEHITIKDNHIMVVAGFYQNLSYVRNGVVTKLYDVSSGRRVFDNHAVLKINPDGTLVWNAMLKFHANNWHTLSDIAVDKNGNSYVVGTYEEYLGIYDADSVEQVKYQGVVGYHKAFMVKYDANGIIKWHNNFTSSHEYGDARLDKILVDDNGNTYIAGSMFNWGEPVSIHITHSDGTVAKDSLASFALYKFDANGKRRWGVGSRYPYYGGTTALYLKDNEVFAAGNISNNGVEISSFIFTSTDGNNRTMMINAAECFIAKYDTAGIYKRVYTSGYNYLANSVTPTSLYTDSKGKFILGGNAGTYHTGVINGMFNMAWPHQLLQGSDGFFAKMEPGFCMPSLTANAGADKNDCVNDTVAIGSNASGDYYSWTSSPAGFTSNLSNPTPRPIVNTTYYLKVTNEEGAIAYDTVLVTVKTSPYANAGNDTTVCGNSGAFIGTPAIAGNTYQWYMPPPFGPFGSGDAQVHVYPNFDQTYYLRVVGPNGCQAWDTITVITAPNGAPIVNIETEKLTVCNNANVVFASVVHNPGPSPIYQWKVNGQNVGTNSDSFTTSSLDHGDEVTLVVTHHNICVSQPTQESNKIVMAVLPDLVPTISVTGNNTVTEGDFTTITSNATQTGTTYKLQWQDSTNTHNWQNLPVPSTAATYSYKPLKTGDKIRCIVTVTNLCVVDSIVESAGLAFVVNKVTGINPVPAGEYGLKFYPNPVQSTLIIDSLRLQDQWQQLEITSIDGRRTFLRMNVNNRMRVQVAVAGLSPGMHVAVLRNRNGMATYLKFVKL